MKDIILAIDVGTTAVKAVLFDLEGRVMSIAQSEYPTHYARPGWAEQDPEDWWRATCSALSQLWQAIPGSAERVIGLSISAQAPTMIAVDADGQPVFPALIWMDRRAEDQSRALAEQLGQERVYELSGNRPDPYYVAPKIMWFRDHHPDKFQRARYFLQINGYLNHRLTGQFTLDHSHTGLLQLMNQKTDEWSPELLDACSISADQLPAIKPGHALCGEVTPAAADATGLIAGTPVMFGTVDGAAAGIEAGVVRAGIAAEMTGTSTVLLTTSSQTATHEALTSFPHALPGLHLLIGAQSTSGACLRWYRDQFGMAEVSAGARLKVSPFDLMTQQAASAEAGSGGLIFLPYMMGERSPIWDSDARGVFFGLSLASTRADFIRAILEGVAFALRHNIETAREAGASIEELRSIGGGSSSTLWNQIKADVLGIPIALPETSVGAPFGDAVLVALGMGVIQDASEFLDARVKVKQRFYPDAKNHARYNQIYPIFRRLYQDLRLTFEHASQLT